MKLTLTYQGSLPPTQKGISRTKAALRRAFHPQIKAQLSRFITTNNDPLLTSSIGGHDFISPVNVRMSTAVELDVLLLTPPGGRPGDVDNRLKTLIDGLTRPANPEQLQGFDEPNEGGPTYCLMEDDKLVQRIGLDSRGWHDPAASRSEALVVVTAKLTLSEVANMASPFSNIFFIL